jgi:hypothetical protein
MSFLRQYSDYCGKIWFVAGNVELACPAAWLLSFFFLLISLHFLFMCEHSMVLGKPNLSRSLLHKLHINSVLPRFIVTRIVSLSCQTILDTCCLGWVKEKIKLFLCMFVTSRRYAREWRYSSTHS